MLKPLRYLLFLAACARPLGAAQAQVAYMDPTFGTAGRATASFTSGTASEAAGQAVALQPDGKLVVAGGSLSGLAMARFLPNGTLDPSFGTGGQVSGQTVPPALGQCPFFTTNLSASASTVLVQADGKIVVGGSYGSKPIGSQVAFINNQHFLVARYMPDGTPDKSFGINGFYSRCGERLGAQVQKVLQQASGELLVLGIGIDDQFLPAGIASQGTAWLIRLLPNGAEDVAYTKKYPPMPANLVGVMHDNYTIEDAFLDDSGRLVTLARQEGSKYALFRHLADGQLDPGFGVGGMKIFEQSQIGIRCAGLPNGQLLVLVQSNTRLLYRLAANGSVDTSFGNNGSVPATAMGVQKFRVQPDGRIVMFCPQGNALGYPTGFGVLRLSANGQPDVTFGNAGFVLLPTNTCDYGSDMVLQPDGKIVLAGTTASTCNAGGKGYQMLLNRVLPTAQLASATSSAAASPLHIAPNPTQGASLQVRLDLPAGAPVALQLVTGLGKAVYQASARATAAPVLVPTAGLAPGLYVLRVQTSAGTFASKVVVE